MERRSSSPFCLLCVVLLLALGAPAAKQDAPESGPADNSTFEPVEVNATYNSKHARYGASREHYPAGDDDDSSHQEGYGGDHHAGGYDDPAHKGGDYDGPHDQHRNYDKPGYGPDSGRDYYHRQDDDGGYYPPRSSHHHHPRSSHHHQYYPQLEDHTVAWAKYAQRMVVAALACNAGTCQNKLPTNIGGVACPSRVIDVPVGSDLSEPEFSKMDVTYRLSPGKYTITSQVQYSAGSNPTPVCYVGPSPDVVTIHLKVSTWAFKLATPGEWLGLQGLTLDGQGQAGVVSVNNGAFAANEVVFIGCPLGAVQVTGAATSVCVLTSTTVTRCGSSTQAAVLMQSPLRTTWANVNFIDNLGAALRCLSDSNVAVFGTAKFVRNSAGSALGVTDTARLSLEYAEFSQNTSPGNGGAISMLAGGNLRITRGLLVDGNTCSQSGGGMHLTGGGRITFAPNSVATFSNNKATVDGGAVMMAQGGNIEFEADSVATFRGNKAEANGGAVSLSDGARLVLYKATMALNSADLGGALYMAVQGKTTVLPGGSICMSGNNAKTTGGGVYMKGATGGVLALDSAAATQVMGGNTPNALVVLEGGRFLCNGGPARGVGNATERIYEINGGSICSCPEPPAATGPLDALGTTTCASCPTGKQWNVDKCSCV